MSMVPLVFVLFCLTVACALPLEKVTNDASTAKRTPREADLFKRLSTKELDGPNGLQVLPNALNDDSFKINGSNDLLLSSADSDSKNHFFSVLASGSRNEIDDDWWLGGTGTYSHKPSGSGLLFKTNQTNSGLEVEANGILKLKRNHTLFGILDLENKPGSLSTGGILGYSHDPTGSEVILKTNKGALGTDLTLTGKTDLFSNDRHTFKSLFSASRDFERKTSSIGADFSYLHKPTGNGLSFGSKLANKKLSLDGVGNWKFNDKHALTGYLTGEHANRRWMGTGGLAYQHKPTNSNLQFGFGNIADDRNLFLKGETNFGSNDEHGFKAAGILSRGLDGSTNYGGTLGYLHKPSNSMLDFGVNSNQGRPQLAGKGIFNFKNGAKLGLGGHFSKGNGFSGGGFEISGAFK